MSLPATPNVVQDLMDDVAERELWIVGREFERPPYFHAGKGMDTRLAKALRVVQEDRIVPNSDGSFTVTGSEGRTYRCAESCSCPNSQKSSSKWCYHLIASSLYVEWRKRVANASTQAPLALGPTSVDARLAGSASAPPLLNLPGEGLVQVHPDGSATPLPPPVPQEDPMTEDSGEYIPEPDDAPVSVAEPQTVTIERPGGRPTTVPLQPQDDDLERALQVWTTQRRIVQRFLKQELTPNIDYYTLKIGGRESKPSLSKAGAEKVMGWLKIQAAFTPDTGTWEMLGRPQDLVVYVCTLRTRSGEIVGEGRGARSIKKDGGDLNKTIKMATKSAQIDAILRTGALSDVFTQDAEDLQETEPPAPAPARPTAQEYRSRIWALVQQRAPHATTREDVEGYVQRSTGYPLHPDRYGEIVAALERSQP